VLNEMVRQLDRKQGVSESVSLQFGPVEGSHVNAGSG
jgi:hypothetical protein